MASVAFQKALAKRKDAAKLMQTAQDAERPSFEVPNLPDAEYLVRVKATCGVSPNKGIPFVEFKWTITEGEYQGKGYNKTYWLENEDPEREEQDWTRLGRDLKTLLGVTDVTITDEQELNDLIEQVDNDTPYIQARTKSTTKGDKTYLNIFFNKRVEVEDSINTVPVDEDGQAGDEVVVAKGNSVIYNGTRYEVVSVNPRERTCTLTNDTDGKQQGISWSAVEVLSA